MYSKDQLITDRLPPIFDSKFKQLQSDITNGVKLDTEPNPHERFIKQAQEFFTSSKRNTITGLEQFVQVDVTMGCHHFIDNLIIKHGLTGLQIFEHDYTYYRRLLPNIQYAKVGSLDPSRPVLLSEPIPGFLDLHPQWNDILDECLDKQIPVHIDGCWMGSATDIDLDLTHPAVASIGLSLSKGLGMHWSRVGVRWTKEYDPTDNICIMNTFGMIPDPLVRNGLVAMREIPIDYLWDTYGDDHKAICRELRLRPTKIIHAAHSIDRTKLYGLANFFQ
jgi:hypothetical protein